MRFSGSSGVRVEVVEASPAACIACGAQHASISGGVDSPSASVQGVSASGRGSAEQGRF